MKKNSTIDILATSKKWDTIANINDIINETIYVCIDALGFSSVEISINLCDNDFIQDLNKKWRNKDKPTNVLSFPMDDDFNTIGKHIMLGDIILAFETITREAEEQNKKFIDHLRHLIIHSFLHLVGHDHIEDKKANLMEEIEIKILEKFNITDPYIIND